MGARWVVHEGDCRDLAREGREHVFDAIVCDPPYDLVSITKRFGKNGSAPAKYGSDGRFARLSGGFMGQKWDSTGVAFDPETWALLLRVVKPGAHLLAFGGTRTHHRLMCALEDAGWEIRDTLMWLYGSGFPKSHDVSKNIDKEQGAEREVVGTRISAFGTQTPGGVWNERFGAGGPGLWVGAEAKEVPLRGGAVTDEAKAWEGWGTAMKPAWEPIALARAPLSEPTVAANVLRWGTGALNIDATRIEGPPSNGGKRSGATALGQGSGWNEHNNRPTAIDRTMASGRWPANVLLDEESATLLDAEVGPRTSGKVAPHHMRNASTQPSNGGYRGRFGDMPLMGYGDSGGVSRFFYTSKASKKDRGPGNNHATCKPTDLMAYLCRLVTPPGGVVLDPFAGSGSTGVAALREGFRFVGIEQHPPYAEIARARLADAECEYVEKVYATGK